MSGQSVNIPESGPVAQFHFLGMVEYEAVLALQSHLAAAAVQHGRDEIVVLLCEHAGEISIGRTGSRRDIHFTDVELERRQLRLRWERRGGPCILHTAGQLAVYPIVPLQSCGWSVGEYLGRLQDGMCGAIASLKIPCTKVPNHFHVWGRTGILAAMGVAIRDWVATQGFWVNVNPLMSDFRFVETSRELILGDKANMGSLSAERQRAVTMPSVRAAVVPALAEALGRSRYYLHTGHPGWPQWKGVPRGSRARVG